MENIGGPVPREMSLEEIQERQYRQKERDLKIARMRGNVVKNQIVSAYTILENIRLDFVSDTAFRDKITQAKRGCESALSDFLLDDSYWKEGIQKHRKLTPNEYAIMMDPNNTPAVVSDQGTGK